MFDKIIITCNQERLSNSKNYNKCSREKLVSYILANFKILMRKYKNIKYM